MERRVEREVPVDKFVDKEIRRTILQPKRKETQIKEIQVQKPQYVDVIHEKVVEKPVTTYVDVVEDVIQDQEVIREVEV